MFSLQFNVKAPWSDDWKNVQSWSGESFIKHKFWELQVMRTSDLIALIASITHRQDHAGVELELGLLGFNIRFNLYDHRHWNTETNEWHRYEQEY